MIPGLIGRVRDGRPVTLNDGGRPRMNPIYVEDAVRAVAPRSACEGSQVLNLAGEEPVTIRDLALLAGEALGREPVFEDGDGAVAGRPRRSTRPRLREVLDLGESVGASPKACAA